jgi:hypothetical protein
MLLQGMRGKREGARDSKRRTRKGEGAREEGV